MIILRRFVYAIILTLMKAFLYATLLTLLAERPNAGYPAQVIFKQLPYVSGYKELSIID